MREIRFPHQMKNSDEQHIARSSLGPRSYSGFEVKLIRINGSESNPINGRKIDMRLINLIKRDQKGN